MLYLLDADNPLQGFPDPALAEREPDGLLAVGGDLSPQRLYDAYRRGIFPWYSEGQPILWWSPDPRTLLFPDQVHIARSLRRTLRRNRFTYSVDRDFSAVIHACAAPRPGADGTWLLPEMIRAYERLHAQGHAHSVEIWRKGELVGGLYGVSIGKAFFGESMFSLESDASKVALVALCRRLAAHGFALLDCQVFNAHLQRMGAVQVPRKAFLRRLGAACATPDYGAWQPALQTPRPVSELADDD